MRKKEIIRFLIVYIWVAVVLIYNGNRLIGYSNNVYKQQDIDNFENIHWENEGTYINESMLEETNKNLKEQEKNKTQESSSQSISSQEASTVAIKGKIITRYISPYEAALSYDGVYVKNNTGEGISIKDLLNKGSKIKLKNSNSPQVLIMHTHTTETFMDEDKDYYEEGHNSRSKDPKKNMVKIGEIICEKLNSAGIVTLHDTTQHDYPQYTGSYGRSAQTVKAYLKDYPDIKVVLDLHRDAVTSGEADKVKLVTQINNKTAAQVMLVMGSQTGSVTGHPNWQENLSLAIKLQQLLEKEYPTLARPLLLNSSKYNQNLTTGSMLLEFGTDANTLEEACYSAELVGNVLVRLFNSMK